MFIPKESMPCNMIKNDDTDEVISIPFIIEEGETSNILPFICFKGIREELYSASLRQLNFNNGKEFAELLYSNACLEFWDGLVNWIDTNVIR